MSKPHPVTNLDASQLADEAIAEFLQATEQGTPLTRSEFIRQHGEIQTELRSFFQLYDQMENAQRRPGEHAGFDSGTLLGRYRLVRPIGSGSFGTVWLGFDSQLKRPVAVKVPRRDRFSNPMQRDLFLTEAQMVAQLEHPHIVPIYDVGETDNGEIYLVSRFVAGKDLACDMQTRTYSFTETARCLAMISDALEYAHERNVIHRDIKPSNILIDATTGQPFLTDFGLALSSESQDAPLGSRSKVEGVGFVSQRKGVYAV